MEQRPGTAFPIEVTPRLPAAIARLEELANNLWFSWDRPARALFARLDTALYEAVGQNPKALLKGVSQRRLEEAAQDPAFLQDLERTLKFDYEREPQFSALLFGVENCCIGELTLRLWRDRDDHFSAACARAMASAAGTR